MVVVGRPTGNRATCAKGAVLDVYLLLLFFLVLFGVCLRAALDRDQGAERAEEDADEGVRVGSPGPLGISDDGLDP